MILILTTTFIGKYPKLATRDLTINYTVTLNLITEETYNHNKILIDS